MCPFRAAPIFYAADVQAAERLVRECARELAEAIRLRLPASIRFQAAINLDNARVARDRVMSAAILAEGIELS